MNRLEFKLEAVATGSRARAARFRTRQGEVLTPLFMPVGTNAVVRAQRHETLQETGSQILLANTYHLLLRPGPEVFRKLGGIQGFMGWDRGVLTDSGGYQIFSLPKGRVLSEEGAAFRSYLDGRKVMLSPELSIGMQQAIGSDIMMVLDHCVPSTCEEREALEAMDRTHRWAERSLQARTAWEARAEQQGSPSPRQALFAIVQGACFPGLRKMSTHALTSLPFDGFAIGGLAVGEARVEREVTTELTAALLPAHLPRYLMGVGTPSDLLEAVHRGVDMFDCILPTAHAQQGTAYTSRGRVDLRRGLYKFSEEKLDPACPCETCQRYSRSYLHHLIKVREVMGWQLVGAHNLAYYHAFMRSIRQSILSDTFLALYREQRECLELDDGNERSPAPPKGRREKPQRLGDFEIHGTSPGVFSIRQIGSGEVMHAVSEPRAEARLLYTGQSGLAERVGGKGPPLVIWDVGLGAATNAMEAIWAYDTVPEARRALRLFSFERDLDPLRLALRRKELFPGLWHPAPKAILEEGFWRSEDGKVEWRLLAGDFLERIQDAPPPELIFYDPFSYKTDPALWTLKAFQGVRDRCGEGNTALLTYSASTRVRAALLSSGFWVGRGVGTERKCETSIALTPAMLRAEPLFWTGKLLDRAWLSRWERSGARAPGGVAAAELPLLEGLIRSHPQFRAERSA